MLIAQYGLGMGLNLYAQGQLASAHVLDEQPSAASAEHTEQFALATRQPCPSHIADSSAGK